MVTLNGHFISPGACLFCSKILQILGFFSRFPSRKPSEQLPSVCTPQQVVLTGPLPTRAGPLLHIKCLTVPNNRSQGLCLTKMFALLLTAVSSLASLSGVAAHGYVQDVLAGGTHYTGYLPYSDPYYNPPPDRIIRKIPGNGNTHVFVSFYSLIVVAGPVQDVTLIE